MRNDDSKGKIRIHNLDKEPKEQKWDNQIVKDKEKADILKNERKYVPYKFEVFRDVNDEFRFRLKAPNGQIIATSEGYKKKQSCIDTIESIQKHASKAVIDVKKRFRVNI